MGRSSSCHSQSGPLFTGISGKKVQNDDSSYFVAAYPRNSGLWPSVCNMPSSPGSRWCQENPACSALAEPMGLLRGLADHLLHGPRHPALTPRPLSRALLTWHKCCSWKWTKGYLWGSASICLLRAIMPAFEWPKYIFSLSPGSLPLSCCPPLYLAKILFWDFHLIT